MGQSPEYKLVYDVPAQLEKILNTLAQDGWRPVAMASLSTNKPVVLLEKK